MDTGISSRIISRTYIGFVMQVDSPLHISNGDGINSDSDVLRDGNGNTFIPGTSLTGAFRNYIGENKNKESIFGYSESTQGRMSSVFVSDVCFSKSVVSLRDGVSLNDDKSVNNKFDMEIIEPGIKGVFRVEYIERENDNPDFSFEKSIKTIIKAINEGEIRFGAKKNRGYGRVRIVDVCEKRFDKSNIDE